jgi:hypothetical protein
MPNQFASNVKLSGPITIAATPDVDFNGFMFSYVIGLMFPPQAAAQVPLRAPYPAAILPSDEIGKIG